jgi:hypothetical protein
MPKNKRRAPRPRKGQSSSARRRVVEQKSAQQSRGGISWHSVIGAAVTAGVVAIAALVFTQTRGGASPAATATAPSVATAASTLARRIDAIPCNDANITYHVHAHLQIVYEGHTVAVPANIGIDDNTCVYYLHTHDNSGELHIEAPTYRYFTLGNFFDIWGLPLSSSRIASFSLRKGQHIRAFLNGKSYGGDPRTIELRAHRLIVLEVGPPFVRPSGFDFQGD